MRFIRGLFTGLGLTLLAILVLVFSLCAISYSTAGNPSFIKGVAESSGLYDNFVESMLEYQSAEALAEDESEDGQAQASDEEDDDGISAEQAEILTDLTPTFQRAMPPERLQSVVETVFDGAVDWLKGNTDEIEFTIDTAEIRDDLTVALADYMEQRIADLPAPPRGASMKDYDPLTAEYAPRDPYSREELEVLAADLADEMPFLDKDFATGADLPEELKDNDTLKTAQRSFWWGRIGVIVFACLLVAGAALAIAFSRNKARVLRRLGHVVFPSAVILLAAGVVLALFVANLDVFGDEATAARQAFDQDITLPLWDSLWTGVASVTLGFGAAWAAIVIVCYVLAHVLKRRQGDTPPPAPASVGPSVETAPLSAPRSAQPPSDSPEQPPAEPSAETTPPRDTSS